MKLINYLAILLAVMLSGPILSQNGHIFISNFQIQNSLSGSKINCIEFDPDGLTFVGTRKGVAIFDGTTWINVPEIPHRVNELKYDTVSNKLFIGLKNEIGELIRNKNGSYSYKSIHKINHPGLEFNKIYTTRDKVYFYSEGIVFVVNKFDYTKYDSITASAGSSFSGIIQRKESVYVNIPGEGFHLIQGAWLKPIVTATDLKTSTILFSTSFNNKNILFGTNKNKIYLFDGKKFIQFARHTEIHDFLEENILWDGVDFSGKYFAVTTLTGGCAIIDKSYGKIEDVINYQTGLPDDEVYAIASDNNNGLWLSHEQGLSRCIPGFPLKSYSTYPGLNGNINDILVKNGILYAATNEGVYSLNKVSYQQVINKRKQRKNRKADKNTDEQKTKKAYIQQSITHQFNKIENLDIKCKKVYSFGNNLIALTNYGVYEIVNSKAKPIKTNIYPNDVHVSSDTTIVYVAALDGIYELHYSVNKDYTKTWKNRKILHSIQSQVFSIAQDNARNLFIGLDSKAFISEYKKTGYYTGISELILPEPTDEPVNIIDNNGEVYFIQSTGIYVYNNHKKKVLYHDIRSITTKDLQYISGKHNAWIKEDDIWKPVLKMQFDAPSELLSMFQNIKGIYTSKNEDVWVITGVNNLVKIPKARTNNFNFLFDIGIRSLKDNADSLHSISSAVIPYSNNAISINLSAPFYMRPEAVKYQYKIQGLKNYEEWSDWSLNAHIELSSVKPGKYVLSARAKNIFNQVSEKEVINIKVLKPFWQTQSFLISSAVSFFALIGLIFYITHRRLLRKKRILELKVQERTIELREEKDKTESLLLNILPKETAEELKKYNKVAPRNYDNATVLFTDFKGFTMIAEKLSPEELVNEIDFLFKEFDRIIGNYRIEKIKTIGDAYMCAGGLPTKYKNNSTEVVKAALDIRDYMKQYKVEKEQAGEPCFEIRIGIHTGKVVAGVVGTKKYAYDIWGDAVNLASRMESSGEPGKVNISGDTYSLIKDTFNCEHRGKIKAKNKGEVDMYFVEGLKQSKRTRKKQ